MHLDSAGQTPGAAAVVDGERSSTHSRGERTARHSLPAVVAGDTLDAIPGAGGGAVPAAALGVVPKQVEGVRGEPGTAEPAADRNRRSDSVGVSSAVVVRCRRHHITTTPGAICTIAGSSFMTTALHRSRDAVVPPK